MPIPYSEIVNQNFQAGSDYLRSVANAARKSYCGLLQVNREFPNLQRQIPGVAALQDELFRRVCELPGEPIPLPPANRLPSNAGQCDCQPYRISYTLSVDGAPFGSSFMDKLGPIGVTSSVTTIAGGAQRKSVGITHRGSPGGICSTETQVSNVLSVELPSDPQVKITSIVPAPDYPFVACDRPTFPTDGPRTPPQVQPTPTIDIPRPPLPPINLPVLPVPLPIAPNINFEPKFVLDVGGININFNVDGVEFSFNPQIDAPITIFPPGYNQPSLPPSVQPDPSGGGLDDCCDTILANQKVINDNVLGNREFILDTRTKATNIDNTVNASVVPGINKIIELLELPESEQFATFTNLQTFRTGTQGRYLTFAQVKLESVDNAKTFNVPGGVEVAIAGWYAFGRDGRWGERRPLQFKENLCLPESRFLTDFTYSVYNGLTASGTVHREKVEEQP